MADDNEANRRQDRRRSVRIASIVLAGAAEPIPCVVLDISSSGARLHVHDPNEVPDTFRLIMASTNDEYACETVWRQGNEMGVRFANAGQASSAP